MIVNAVCIVVPVALWIASTHAEYPNRLALIWIAIVLGQYPYGNSRLMTVFADWLQTCSRYLPLELSDDGLNYPTNHGYRNIPNGLIFFLVS